jgi:hypothetical protein
VFLLFSFLLLRLGSTPSSFVSLSAIPATVAAFDDDGAGMRFVDCEVPGCDLTLVFPYPLNVAETMAFGVNSPAEDPSLCTWR